MVFTESMDYHVNHIGSIRINKDRLMDEHNIDIVITRKRFGEYQTIDISGSSKNISNVKKQLNEIIEIASYEYNEFRQRKKDRQRSLKQKFNTIDYGLKNSLNKSKTIKQNRNPFDALAVDEDLNNEIVNDYNNEYPELLNTTSNVSWADMSDDDE
jgi:hypothetical protein